MIKDRHIPAAEVKDNHVVLGVRYDGDSGLLVSGGSFVVGGKSYKLPFNTMVSLNLGVSHHVTGYLAVEKTKTEPVVVVDEVLPNDPLFRFPGSGLNMLHRLFDAEIVKGSKLSDIAVTRFPVSPTPNHAPFFGAPSSISRPALYTREMERHQKGREKAKTSGLRALRLRDKTFNQLSPAEKDMALHEVLVRLGIVSE